MFFEVKTKRLTVTVTNKYRRVREHWLFEVDGFTEAEAAATTWMRNTYPLDTFEIIRIQPSRIQYVDKADGCEPDAPLWKSRIDLIETNDFDKEIRTAVYVLIRANNAKLATEHAEELAFEISDEMNVEAIKTEKTRFAGVVMFEKATPPNEDGEDEKKKAPAKTKKKK